MAAGLPTATYVTQFEFANALAQSWANPAPGDGEKIEKALRRAIELNPSFPDAYEMLAWKLRQRGEPGRGDAVGEQGARPRAGPRGLRLPKGGAAGQQAGLHGRAQPAHADHPRWHRRDRAGERAAGACAGGRLRTAKGSVRGQSHCDRARRRHRQLSRRDSRPAADRPALRPMQPGEKRVFGKLTAIQCAATGVMVVVRTPDGATLRAHATKFDPNRLDYVPQRLARRRPVWRQGRRRPSAADVHSGRQQHEFRDGGCCGFRAARLHALTGNSAGGRQ